MPPPGPRTKRMDSTQPKEGTVQSLRASFEKFAPQTAAAAGITARPPVRAGSLNLVAPDPAKTASTVATGMGAGCSTGAAPPSHSHGRGADSHAPVDEAAAALEATASALRKSRNIRVFISSSFLDMKAERQALMERAFPVLRSLCVGRGMMFTEVDMRWGIQEETEGASVVATCLKEVQLCSPYIICLLGQRYGWVPPKDTLRSASLLLADHEWLESEAGSSVTHLEIHSGILRHKDEKKKRALVYVRDPSFIESVPVEERGDYVGSDEDARRLDELKAQLKREGVPFRTYLKPEDVPKMVVEDLSRSIEQDFPDTLKGDILLREKLAHEAFAHSRCMLYVIFPSHETIVNREINARGDALPPLHVTGPSGSGKSSLVAYISLRLMTKKDSDVLVFSHFVGHSSHSANYVFLLQRLMAQLREWAGSAIRDVLPDDPQQLVSQLPSWLAICAHANPSKRIFVILDALNQLQDIDNALNLTWLPNSFPSNVHVVTSSVPGKVVEKMRARQWRVIDMPEILVPDRKKLATHYLKHYGKQLEPARLDRVVNAPQTKNPLHLKLLLDELRVVGEYGRLDEQISRLLGAQDVISLFTLVLERLEKSYGLSTVESLMSFIGRSRHGMSENELIACMGLARSVLSPLLYAAGESLLSQTGLLLFTHQALELSVEQRYLASKDKKIAVHRNLARYFGHPTVDIDRRCAELPWHLQQSEDKEALVEFLTDIESYERMTSTEFKKLELASYWRSVDVKKAGGLYRQTLDRHFAANRDMPVIKRVALIFRVAISLHEWALYDDSEKMYQRAISVADTSGSAAFTAAAEESGGAGVARQLSGSVERQLSGGVERQPSGGAGIGRQLSGGAGVGREFSGGVERELSGGAEAAGEEGDEGGEWTTIAGRKKPSTPQHHNGHQRRQQQQQQQQQKNGGQPRKQGGSGKDGQTSGSSFAERIVTYDRETALLISEVLERLARLYSHQSRMNEARKMLLDARHIREQICGPESLEVSKVMDELSWVQIVSRSLKGPGGAVDLLQRSILCKTAELRTRLKLKTPTSNDIEDPTWQEILKAAVRASTDGALIGDKAVRLDTSFPAALNKLAVAYSNIQRMLTAEQLFKHSLRVHENIWGPDHPYVATVIGDLGSLYRRRIEVLDKLIVKRIKAANGAGANDAGEAPVPRMASQEVSELYIYDQEDEEKREMRDDETIEELETKRKDLFDLAKTLLKRAMDIRQQTLGDHHPFFATSLVQYADILYSVGQRAEAHELFQKCYNIRLTALGADNPQTKAAVRRLQLAK